LPVVDPTMPVALTSLVPPALLAIVRGAPGLERSYLVGGAVRDWLLGATAEEWDVEVFGVSYDELAAALAPFGKTVLVGRSFGVVKLTTPAGESFDFTVPRRDSKVAPGHRGFETSCWTSSAAATMLPGAACDTPAQPSSRTLCGSCAACSWRRDSSSPSMPRRSSSAGR
jgi:hypothetical protein